MREEELEVRPATEPQDGAPDVAGTGDDVEGRRDRCTRLDEGQPQFRARELPLHVPLALPQTNVVRHVS